MTILSDYAGGPPQVLIDGGGIGDVALGFVNKDGHEASFKYDGDTEGLEFRVNGMTPADTKMFIGNNGFVGIGTIMPSQALDVTGQIHATGDICTDEGGGACLSTAGGGGGSGIMAFGEWATRSKGISYQAATDGIVVVHIGSAQGEISGFTDGSDPPGTMRSHEDQDYGAGGVNLTMPVKKNDFWQVTSTHQGNPVTIYVYWIPLLSGGGKPDEVLEQNIETYGDARGAENHCIYCCFQC